MDKELQKEDEQITTFGCGRYFERERERMLDCWQSRGIN